MSKNKSEAEIIFRKASEEAEKHSPAIIFIDQIETLSPAKTERSMVSQILALMDRSTQQASVVVIGAAIHPNGIDPALRGRFDCEIDIGVPDAKGCLKILKIHTRSMKLDDDVDLEVVARETHGFVGGDIAALCAEAGLRCFFEKKNEMDTKKSTVTNIFDSIAVNQSHFRHALAQSNPSSLRETIVEVPNVTWDDIGGMEQVKVR